MYNIVTKYKVSRQELRPTSRQDPWTGHDRIDLATYEEILPNHFSIKEFEQKMKTMYGT